MSHRRTRAACAVLALALSLTTACATESTASSSAPVTVASPTSSTVRVAAQRRAAVTARHSAWVSVAVARLWQSPSSPRRVDRPALAAPVRFRAWLKAMTLSQRRALSSHSDTEALMGERVVVRRVSGAWARVVVPDQPSQKAAGGYPGWIPLRQLTGSAPASTASVATVVKRTAWLGRDKAGAARVTEISSGTTLPFVGRVGHFVRVRVPRGTVRRMGASAVVVHRRGTAALAPHQGVLATAKHYLGLAYLWGGLSGFGLDCSGLTWLSNRLHGTRIPRDALPQSRHGTSVPRSRLARGDLIFYATRGLVHHVTMYAGSGRMIEAPHTGAVTRIVPVRSSEYYGARRY